MGRKVEFTFPPKRIISLVPSQTELLYDLGLAESVVGITKFCIHPQEWFKTKTRVGGTKKINLEKIKELSPDLIIGNKEENEKSQIEELMKIPINKGGKGDLIPIWMSDIKNIEDALEMINSIGEITNTEIKAKEISSSIKKDFDKLQLKLKTIKPLRTLYLIWAKPYMSVGSDTFIGNILSIAQFENVITSSKRYPELTEEEIRKLNPEIILLSSEPYPFKEKHIAELSKICPNAKIKLVDGELFSWYGSRLLQASSYLENIVFDIHS